MAVRVSAARQEHLRVHRIPPRVRDDREPPLRWDETARISEVIWVGREEEYFYKGGWTGQITLIRFDNLPVRQKKSGLSHRGAYQAQ